MVSGIFVLPLDPPASELSARKDADCAPRAGDFLVGEENAVLRAIAGFPASCEGRRASPLFLYGPSQSGKTHLAVGLMQRWEAVRKHSPARFLTGIDFARSYARAVSADEVAEFRRSLTELRLLIVDDLCGLARKTGAQRELERLLDDTGAGPELVVLTCSLPPAELSFLSSSLRSRVLGGLPIRLAPPGRAVRERYLRAAAMELGLLLDAGEAERLAAPEASSLTELRGALLRRPVSGEIAIAPDGGSVASAARANARLSLSVVARCVAKYYGLNVAELRSPTRRKSAVLARSVAMHLGRELQGYSLSELGRAFGGRDHTTVLHACQKIAAERARDPALAAALGKLTIALQKAALTAAAPGRVDSVEKTSRVRRARRKKRR